MPISFMSEAAFQAEPVLAGIAFADHLLLVSGAAK